MVRSKFPISLSLGPSTEIRVPKFKFDLSAKQHNITLILIYFCAVGSVRWKLNKKRERIDRYWKKQACTSWDNSPTLLTLLTLKVLLDSTLFYQSWGPFSWQIMAPLYVWPLFFYYFGTFVLLLGQSLHANIILIKRIKATFSSCFHCRVFCCRKVWYVFSLTNEGESLFVYLWLFLSCSSTTGQSVLKPYPIW